MTTYDCVVTDSRRYVADCADSEGWTEDMIVLLQIQGVTSPIVQTARVGLKMDDVDFTDDEISKELADLGYCNIPAQQFHQFKKGFENLCVIVVYILIF